MTARTVYICDQCGREEQAYAPHGWRRIWYGAQALRGQLHEETKAHVCSLPCEQGWVAKNVLAPLQEEVEQLNKERNA